MLYQQFGIIGKGKKTDKKVNYSAREVHNVKPEFNKIICKFKTSLYRPTLRKICNRIENTLPKTYQKEALCLSQSRERRKFKTYSEREHSGSHAIAWAAITIS